MTIRSFSISLGLLAMCLLLAGCSTSSSVSDPYNERTSRVYVSDYGEVVEIVAQTIQDVGLSLESTGLQTESTYALNASRLQTIGSEPVQVASFKIFVDKLDGGAVRVRFRQQKTSRTSMAGNSSLHSDYGGKLFKKLDERLELPKQADGQPKALSQ